MAESPCSSAISLAASAISAARSAGVFRAARFCMVLDITQQSKVVFLLLIMRSIRNDTSHHISPHNTEETSMAWRMPAETAPHERTWMAFPRTGLTLGDDAASAEEAYAAWT